MPKVKAIELTFDRIRNWINNPDSDDLSEKDKEIYVRWDYAYDQLKTEKPVIVVQRLMKKFNISQPLAYKDLRECQKLLSPVNRRDTEWIRNFLVEDLILQIKVARESNDKKLWEKANANLIKIYAIEKGEREGIDPETLGNNNYYVVINAGNKIEKIDYNKLTELEPEKKMRLTDFLFPEIESTVEAEKIMKS